jgi:flavin reductase (DIM6/NTAB) family NADH-FMN oxidoreductase RutF
MRLLSDLKIMTESAPFNAIEVMANIPHGAFILTASYEGRRSGTRIFWMQPCSIEPPMVMLAVPKGQIVDPLIRDSRHFALCQVCEGDRFLLRKFEPDDGTDRTPENPRERYRNGSIEHPDDPFVCLPTRLAPSGSPVIERCLCYLDCEVLRQVELDGDHRLYVGTVIHAEMLQSSTPAVFHGRVDRV